MKMHNKGNIVALFVPEITPHRNQIPQGVFNHTHLQTWICAMFLILKTKHLNDLCQNSKIKTEH